MQALAILEERRSEFTTRWLWELIQNARDFPDPSRRMTIRINLTAERIRFAHNGRDFTRAEILSLIYHGSTKQANEEQLGKFGTGFLSTHLLSRRVNVKGTLCDEKHGRRSFEFELDRSGEDAGQVGAAMQRSFEALEESLARTDLVPTNWTEFVYEADGALDTEELESNFPFDALPYILVFDEKVDKIEIQLPERRAVYVRSEGEELERGRLTVIEGVDSARGFSTLQENGIHAAVPVERRPDGRYEIMPPGDVPRLFKFLPLVNSKDIGLPVVFHSALFFPTENRDGLQFGADGTQSDFNKQLLTTAVNCFIKLAGNCAADRFHELQRLLDVRAVSDTAWLVDRSKYAEIQHSIIRGLAAIPLIRLETEELVPASAVDLPLGDDTMVWQDVFKFGSSLAADKVLLGSIAEDCSTIAQEWTDLFGCDDALIRLCVLTPARLIERVKDTGSLKELGAVLEREPAETVEWLNGLISCVPEVQRALRLDCLIPDQTPEGAFRSNADLSRDPGIDDALKDVLEALDEPVRGRLIHRSITGTDVMIKRVQQQAPLVASAKDLLKKRTPPHTQEFRAACLTMFQWLALEGLWDDLKDAIPVYTVDSDETEIISKTSVRAASLLAPRVLWPEQARAYWDAFPKGSVLNDDYASLLDSSLWSEAAANDVVVIKLLWSEETELTDLEKYMHDRELDGDSHSTPSPIRVGKLAFVGTERLYDALRGSRERATRFFQFILDYVIDADHSWKQLEQVSCECGRQHEIIPCEWLSWIREREWVPRQKGHERLTDGSLSRLTRHDSHLADTVTREEHADFLNVVGINVLEQALLGAGPSQSSELRRKLAQLARLAVQHPGTVTQLINDIQAHHEADKRWQQNQKLGKIVEELIQLRLKSRLSFFRIRVRAQFIGYDIGAYVDDSSVADVGAIDVEVGTLLAKIEIKATRGKTVSISNRQGDEASNDQGRFWLCVVPLDFDEDIDGLTVERVEDRARFVSEIGSRLAPARNGIRDAVQRADVSGFDLEHIDEIRYGIRADLWNEALPLRTFAEILGKQASAIE